MRDLEPVGRELNKKAPTRVVYSTAWRHLGFGSIDSSLFVEKCYEGCESDPDLIEKLFRLNAENLWDVSDHE